MAFGAPVKDAVFVVVLYPVFSLRVDGWQVVGFAGIVLRYFPVAVNSDCRR